AVRFTLALGVPLDDWLLPEAAAAMPKKRPHSRAITRRMAMFETLPRHQQRLILTALDMLLIPFARQVERIRQTNPSFRSAGVMFEWRDGQRGDECSSAAHAG